MNSIPWLGHLSNRPWIAPECMGEMPLVVGGQGKIEAPKRWRVQAAVSQNVHSADAVEAGVSAEPRRQQLVR
jgi:hypothetical protein